MNTNYESPQKNDSEKTNKSCSEDVIMEEPSDNNSSTPEERNELLSDVVWNIACHPLGIKKPPNIDFNRKIFDSPVYIHMKARNTNETYKIHVTKGTIYDTLFTIYKFYQDMEDNTVMGDHVFFEGLVQIAPNVWYVILGS